MISSTKWSKHETLWPYCPSIWSIDHQFFFPSVLLPVCVPNILVCPKLGKRGQNEAKIAQWTIFQNMLDFPQRGPWLPKRTVLFCIENFSCHQLGKREQNWLRKWLLCLFINIFALDFSDFFNEGIEISFHNQNH